MIKFNNLADRDLSELRDAFTGATLNTSLPLHQCQNCKVFYHSESIEVINKNNAGQCISCYSINIKPFMAVISDTNFIST